MALSDLTAANVQSAVLEYQALGPEGVYDEYGFTDAKRYWLIYDGGRYPSKAIAGIAHKYATGEPWPSNTFGGGEASVVTVLERLGFNVERSARNPDWTSDELTLALDMYMTNPSSPPGKKSAAVRELSAILVNMRRLAGSENQENFRNTDGVYLKLMNFRALDPTFTSVGKVGMKRGGKLDKDVWAEYFGRRAALSADAQAIRLAVLAAERSEVATLPTVEPYEGEEGGVIIRIHKRFERDPKLVRKKREAALASGSLSCEVCSFNFASSYGVLGTGFIEVHHLKPVSQLPKRTNVKLEDLAILCANCHRMAHRRRLPLSLDEIREARKQS